VGRIVSIRVKEKAPDPPPIKFEGTIAVERAPGVKCPRCWNYHTIQGNPMEVCDRCIVIVTGMVPDLIKSGAWTQADGDEWRALVQTSVNRWKATT
jgi:hypothetical protein